MQLEDRQLEALRKLAAQTGRSIVDLIREAVDVYLARRRNIGRALGVAGKFASGLSDVSSEHDRYVAGAFKH